MIKMEISNAKILKYPMTKDPTKQRAPYKRFRYTELDLLCAIDDIKQGVETINNASKKYGIPKGTLHNKLTEKVPLSRRMGPKPILSEEEEDKLERWILNNARVGFPMDPDTIKDTVQNILKNVKRENPFKNDRPGKKWLSSFLKRKPNLAKHNSEIISKLRPSAVKDNLKSWFHDVRSFLAEENCSDILDDGNRIFIGNEAAMQISSKKPNLGSTEGPQNEGAGQPEKQSITILRTFSANGKSLPSLIVFPYNRAPEHFGQTFPTDWMISWTDSGWMRTNTFFEYITNLFHPWLLEQRVKFPVILFLDGYKSRLSMEVCDFCLENGIILYCSPPNSGHSILQTNPTGANFQSAKTCWSASENDVEDQSLSGSARQQNLLKNLNSTFGGDSEDQSIKTKLEKCGLLTLDESVTVCSDSKSFVKSVENLPVDGSRSVDEPSLQDYAVAKRVIESILGSEYTKYLIRLKEENNECQDSLFGVWKLCADKTAEIESTEAGVYRT